MPRNFESAFSTYTFVSSIGNGGSGSVFLATDESGEEYAVKELNSASSKSTKLARFRNEVEFCRHTNHPNVIKVLDDGFVISGSEKRPFYVMRYYEATLRSIMEQDMEHEEVLEIFYRLLEGVSYVHEQGVSHRDLKPENVLLGDEGRELVVADFGIAEFNEEQMATLVETGQRERLANFGYAAPEQRVPGGAVDKRADIYSLGLMLNEMFTGKVPVGTGYVLIGSVAPKLAYLDGVVEWMIRQQPEDRPEDLRQVVLRIKALASSAGADAAAASAAAEQLQAEKPDYGRLGSPPLVVSKDYRDRVLYLTLDRPVDADWVSAFQTIGNFSAVGGSEPRRWRFDGQEAIVGVDPRRAKEVVDYFDDYAEKASVSYRAKRDRDAAEAETKAKPSSSPCKATLAMSSGVATGPRVGMGKPNLKRSPMEAAF